ncbi:sugar phosphate isomerase/epimerase [Rhodoferax sp.]|uniref:sugar phosphate isomerase/epimerase family protein n=1 Tax=Rhodoferax sp. TaxID=50421 RepID=UPI00260CDF0A|nr:sugar phosphate isomerase/epimerase [Rhodoferax sp.]MDD3937082.1 sugar phosphate isomerase/epimerase [Rhodoferax sp.]
MKHDYSLAHLTAMALPPVDLIEVAAKTGYDFVGLRLSRVTDAEPLYPIITSKTAMAATKARLAATGVKVWDVELARMDPSHDAESYIPMLEATAELGAHHVICQLPDPNRERAHERFARLCDYAKPLGITVSLEFPWWTETGNLETATTVLNTVKRDNAGMLVDMLHFFRSNSSLEALKVLPREWFHFAHVCDGPRTIAPGMDSILHEARSLRYFPGDGDFGVKDILACLPDPITYCLEIPGDALAAEIGFEEYARRALKTAQAHLD